MQEQEAPSPESEAVAHRRIQKQEQELFEYAMVHLKGLCTVLGVPEGGKKRAIRIYRRAVEKHLMAGHSIEGMAGGAILLACHEQNIPLQVDDLAQHSCASTRDIRRCYQLLLQSFHAPRFFSRFF
ncbi:MAG: hypothetical protein HWN66_06540 [Candidatus Helarchaeota archaeon]|nr:hypothetical protein [Candidatus Helarchaeota archaeon]